MTNAEYIKTIPTLTNKELLEELDYCGYDSYYRTIREPVIEEITKRLNRIAELEKENAELKSENKKWKDEWQEQVQKATDEGYARTLQTIQLSKAKEIIKNLLSAYTTYADSFDDRDNEIVEEACQFISEVEK